MDSKFAQNIDKDTLATLLKEAEVAHADYEKSTGKLDEDWPLWYAKFIINRLKE